MEHVLVYHERDKSCYGPANNGIWSWGDEILVGFTKAIYQPDRGKPPLAYEDRPHLNVQARSQDGGRSWIYEDPPNLGRGFTSKGTVAPQEMLPVPFDGIHFTHPDFAMRFGGAVLRVSYDRGRSWLGPYPFGDLGLETITARTSYLVEGSASCLMFLSGRSSKFTILCNLPDRAFCARTDDGGQTFQFLGWMVAEDPAPRSLMPSVVRLPSGRLVAGLRRRLDTHEEGVLRRVVWIDAYSSDDNGQSWHFFSKIADTETFPYLHNGNPPHLLRLADGRLVAVYGYRSPPCGIHARVSRDEGVTWDTEIVLRSDGRSFDLGYPRSVIRPDGKIVTCYWISTDERQEAHIAATIWHPDEVKTC